MNVVQMCVCLGWANEQSLGAGRLEDKSSIVRRAALQLLMALLLYNPFGARLPEACFAASLAEYKAKLQVRYAAFPAMSLEQSCMFSGALSRPLDVSTVI